MWRLVVHWRIHLLNFDAVHLFSKITLHYQHMRVNVMTWCTVFFSGGKVTFSLGVLPTLWSRIGTTLGPSGVDDMVRADQVVLWSLLTKGFTNASASELWGVVHHCIVRVNSGSQFKPELVGISTKGYTNPTWKCDRKVRKFCSTENKRHVFEMHMRMNARIT